MEIRSKKEVTESKTCDLPMNLIKHTLKDSDNMSDIEVKFNEYFPSELRLLMEPGNHVFDVALLHLLHMAHQQTKLSLPALIRVWWTMWPVHTVSSLMLN